MSWIEEVPPHEAQGPLAGVYRRISRSGRIANILRVQSLQLTRAPGAVTRADVDAVRSAGHTDEAVLHAAEVIAYFAFVNRLADGLGVDLEP